MAIGLGNQRTDPLPIGSIKTHLGHLEPASESSACLKALLSLNHGLLPPSLHFTTPNPNIDFHQLNLTVANKGLLLPNAHEQCAGVNSFGFGGTNAHVVVAGGRKLGEGVFTPSDEETAFLRDFRWKLNRANCACAEILGPASPIFQMKRPRCLQARRRTAATGCHIV